MRVVIIVFFLNLIHCNSFAAPGDTIRISVDSSGTQSTNLSNSSWPAISGNGRYIAFVSSATNLIQSDLNNTSDIFIRDTASNVTSIVSLDSSGLQSNGISRAPSISDDGRYVAFISAGSNLVVGDTNGVDDVFVRDRTLGTTKRVSISTFGLEANGFSYITSISANGRYIAFHSAASNLVTGDSNSASDVFVHDQVLNTTLRVSVDSSGLEGNGHSELPSISSDGQHIAFVSRATNLVIGDTNAIDDVFVHDLNNGMTQRVSVDSFGVESNGRSFWPSISSSGLFVAYYSQATNLVSSDTNGLSDIFVYDSINSITKRASIDSSGFQSIGGDSYEPSISSDGRYIGFRSSATNLVSGDTNNQFDVFVHDTMLNITSRVSVDSLGQEANSGRSFETTISDDGRYIAFTSSSTNLVSNDTNGTGGIFGSNDVFVHDFSKVSNTAATAIPTLSNIGILFLIGVIMFFGLRFNALK